MFNLPCNINKRERIVRGVVGGILLLGALLGLGKAFAILVGLLMAASAAISYCGIIDLIERFKLDSSNGNVNMPPPPENKPPL